MQIQLRDMLGLLVVVGRRALEVFCVTGPCCRFTPTCSLFAKEAVETHGAVKGIYLTGRRLLKCQFLGPSGWDPVPGGRQHGI